MHNIQYCASAEVTDELSGKNRHFHVVVFFNLRKNGIVNELINGNALEMLHVTNTGREIKPFLKLKLKFGRLLFPWQLNYME